MDERLKTIYYDDSLFTGTFTERWRLIAERFCRERK